MTNIEIQHDEDVEVIDIERDIYQLIVWNDDINTFDWVAKALIDICDMSTEQAEQCSVIIHYKGKYEVKHGSFAKMKKMCNAIQDRGISATVEK